jgi:hypothetical protein
MGQTESRLSEFEDTTREAKKGIKKIKTKKASTQQQASGMRLLRVEDTTLKK